MSDKANTFNPKEYLTKVKGKDYLEVKWRLKWLRDVQPDATIETELVRYTDVEAIFKATVTLPDGGAATGHKAQGPNDFGDWLEKAETGAIGRALAALGFGTQFTDDFDMGEQVVDAPVQRPRPPKAPQAPTQPTMTEKMHQIRQLREAAKLDSSAIIDYCKTHFGFADPTSMNTGQADKVIAWLERQVQLQEGTS